MATGLQLRRTIICLALAAAALSLYWPARDFQLLRFDDDIYVSDNPHVLGGLRAEGAAWAFSSFYEGYWLPLTWISYMMDAELCGPGPRGFHTTNMMLHAANGMLLFLALSGMTGAVWASALAAALFLLHPLHVESVAWVTERKDVLSAFFFLAGLLAYLRYLRRPGPARYILVALSLALGLMSKPMLVTFPLLLLLLDGWPLGRWCLPGGRGDDRRQGRGRALAGLLLEKAPLLAMSAAMGVVVLISQRHKGSIISLEHFPMGLRLATALGGYLRYLAKAVWPSGLAADYEDLAGGRAVAAMLVGGAVVLTLTVKSLISARRRPAAAVGWFWYLITLLPVIGLVRVGLTGAADRFAYLPLIGIYLAVSWWLLDLLRGRGPWLRAALIVAILLVLAAFTAASRLQLLYWRDDLTLFTRAAAVNPASYVAHTNIGAAYYRLGLYDDAVRYYRKALELNPGGSMALFNLGLALDRLGRLPEAVESYSKAVVVNPAYAKAHHSLARVLDRMGFTGEAVGHFEAALAADPSSVELHLELSRALDKVGRKQEAKAHYEAAMGFIRGGPSIR